MQLKEKMSRTISIDQLNCSLCLYNKSKCICQPFWKTFKEDISTKIQNSSLYPTSLRVSTITFNYKLNNVTLDLNNLTKQFKKSLFCRELKFKENSKKSRKNLDLNYNFYNQCTITSFIPKDDNIKELVKVSTKIFHNGSCTVTGTRSISNIIVMIRQMVNILNSYNKVINLIDPSKPMGIEYTKINMINSDFTIKKKIRQKLLNKIINYEEYSLINGGNIKRSVFDPDGYHGVKIKYVHKPPTIREIQRNEKIHLTRKGIEKYKGEVTISVFNTGAVIITGGKTPEETISAYKFINKIFEDYKDMIIKDDIIFSKKKKKVYIKNKEIFMLKKELNDENIQIKNPCK
jgi:TATA-box binding protein (TBP) (component of TFIID and TFIIIB)